MQRRKWDSKSKANIVTRAARQRDLEKIRKVQIEFNEAVRRAHAEILELAHNKDLQQTR